MLRTTFVAKQQGQRVESICGSLRSLLSSEQFRWAIDRESQRVDRMGAGDLTLVLFRVARGKRRLSTLRLARTILSRIRVTDDLGWFDREHIGVLLPETSAAGAWNLAHSICDTIAQRGTRPLCSVYNYPAIAEDAMDRSESKEQLKAAS